MLGNYGTRNTASGVVGGAGTACRRFNRGKQHQKEQNHRPGRRYEAPIRGLAVAAIVLEAAPEIIHHALLPFAALQHLDRIWPLARVHHPDVIGMGVMLFRIVE